MCGNGSRPNNHQSWIGINEINIDTKFLKVPFLVCVQPPIFSCINTRHARELVTASERIAAGAAGETVAAVHASLAAARMLAAGCRPKGWNGRGSPRKLMGEMSILHSPSMLHSTVNPNVNVIRADGSLVGGGGGGRGARGGGGARRRHRRTSTNGKVKALKGTQN